MSVTLKTTHGDLKIEVFCDRCPLSAKNFMALCASGYYTDTPFHRNVKTFMIQGGDPMGTGQGGKSIYGKPFEDEIHPELKHSARGMIAYANSGANSNNSQFYILYGAAAHLDNTATVFAKVIDGFETLDRMEKAPVDEAYSPTSSVRIIAVRIHANPIADLEGDEKVIWIK